MLSATLRNWNRLFRPADGAPEARRLWVRRGAEIGLGVLLAVQAGRLAWIILVPAPTAPVTAVAPDAPAPDYSIFQRFDAFFRTGSAGGEAAAQDNQQMRLFGVRADGAGGGSAIIGLADGRQLSVGVGEEVEPGLILKSVDADHVVLARGASLSRLMFTELPMGAATPPPPPAGQQVVTPQGATAQGGDPDPVVASPNMAQGPSGPIVDPARLMAQAGLRPRMQGLGMNGFTVSGTGDGTALAAAGLKSGDVILSVNGQALDSPNRIAGLRGQLSNSTSAEIRFERNGVEQTTTIRTGR